ncbi:hypothetical protein, partial [Luteococcus japonicus]|uniref:hypothetical protein n=1 Tax=Luteococcus japonicus TaxID=33984 RepID=UPI001B86E302
MAERRFTLTPALRPKERPVELDEAQLRVVTHRGTPGQGTRCWWPADPAPARRRPWLSRSRLAPAT